MFIDNIRAGFATNSSSTHSVVIIPDNLLDELPEIGNYDGLTYGWENFVLRSPQSKMGYLAAQMYGSLRYNDKQLDEGVIHKIVREITGVDLREYETTSYNGNSTYIDASVDHQSAWNLRGFDIESQDHLDFFNEFSEYLKQENIVIFGGNDNSDGNPYIPSKGKSISFLDKITDCYYNVVRKDGDYYTLYNSITGMKVRLTLKSNVKPYRKSTTPELVDLKITQFCPYGCEFCYMSSTKDGVHAKLSDIKKYVDYMAEMRVFEIALGGGEPTMHPDFIEILEYIHSRNITVNFTTFSTAWLKNQDIVEAVVKYVSAIGVSVLTEKCVSKVNRIFEKISEHEKENKSRKQIQVMAQHVLGSIDAHETINILKTCWERGHSILLLGYKKVGFGKGYKSFSTDDVIAFLKLSYRNEKYYGRACNFLAVDTQFVHNFRPILEQMGVSSKLITKNEGKFSMYIDAVENKMSASSYDKPNKMTEAPATVKEMVEIYATY